MKRSFELITFIFSVLSGLLLCSVVLIQLVNGSSTPKATSASNVTEWQPSYSFGTTTLTLPIRVTQTTIHTVTATTLLPVTLIDVDVVAAGPRQTETLTYSSTITSLVTLMTSVSGNYNQRIEATAVLPTTSTRIITHTFTDSTLAGTTTLWQHVTVPPDCYYIDLKHEMNWLTRTVTEILPKMVDFTNPVQVTTSTSACTSPDLHDPGYSRLKQYFTLCTSSSARQQPTTLRSEILATHAAGNISMTLTRTQYALKTETETRTMTITSTRVEPTRVKTTEYYNKTTTLKLVPVTSTVTHTITSVDVDPGDYRFYGQRTTITFRPVVFSEIHTVQVHHTALPAVTTRQFLKPMIDDCSQVDNVTLKHTALILVTKTLPMPLARYAVVQETTTNEVASNAVPSNTHTTGGTSNTIASDHEEVGILQHDEEMWSS